MNIQQAKEALILIQNSLGMPDDPDYGGFVWASYSPSHLKHVRYKKWKLRYLPNGRVFIFNGKQKVQHTFIFLYNSSGNVGFTYWRYGAGHTSYFYYPRNEAAAISGNQYVLTYDSQYYADHFLCTDSDESKINSFFEMIANDFTESLEIRTEEDFIKFKTTINLIGIENI